MTTQRSSKPGDEAPTPRRGQRLAGLRGLLEAFRRVPAALRRPETLMLVMAILASFGAHMPPYMGLGALADYFEEKQRERAAQEPVEVSYEWSEPAESEPKPEPEPPEPEPEKPRREPEPEPRQRAEKKAPPKPEPEPSRSPKRNAPSSS